ncbi:MAG: hypothetical protein ACREJ3_09335 [Polyangiaceae bacterium]
MKNGILPAGIALITLAVTECTSLSSSDIKTAGITGEMQVSADGSGASTVSANLYVDTNLTDFVSLSSGDTLTASAGGQTKTLSKSTLLGIVTYLATFTGEDGAGTAYTIAFNRMSDTSAPSSTCAMPSPFAISAPASSASFSRSRDPITITWSPAGTSDVMNYSVGGDCIATAGSSISGDTGTLTIPAGTISGTALDGGSANGGTGATGCPVTLSMTRTRNGSLDSHFLGGGINCLQTRTVSFQSTP